MKTGILIVLLISTINFVNYKCQETQNMNSGVILYNVTVVVPKNAPKFGLYSKALHLDILNENIAGEMKVYFDGNFSKTEAITNDYGIKSLSSIIRDASSTTNLFCKAFPHLNFCIPFEDEVVVSESFPAPVQILNEEKEIAGYTCQKAIVEEANRTLHIWFTKDIHLTDPTNAVLQHDDIKGLILEMEDIPAAKNVYFYKKYSLQSIDLRKLKQSTFQVPDDYQTFEDIDKARAINRKKTIENAEKELNDNPPTEQNKSQYTGYWLFETAKDKIMLHIQQNKEEKSTYYFSSINLTRTDTKPSFIQEQAKCIGEKLLVEAPPNYRIYKIEQQLLMQENNTVFHFQRLERAALKQLQTEFPELSLTVR